MNTFTVIAPIAQGTKELVNAMWGKLQTSLLNDMKERNSTGSFGEKAR